MHFAYPLPWWLAVLLAAAVAASAFLEYRRPLAPLTRTQRGVLAGLRVLDVAVRQVRCDDRLERVPRLGALGDGGQPGPAVVRRAIERLLDHGVARREVGVEPAVGQPGLLHHVGDAGAGVAMGADRAPRGLHDPLVGLGLDAARGARHMTLIIFTTGPAGKPSRNMPGQRRASRLIASATAA